MLGRVFFADIGPRHSGIVYESLPQFRLEEDLCWIVPLVPQTTQSVKGLNWPELNLQE